MTGSDGGAIAKGVVPELAAVADTPSDRTDASIPGTGVEGQAMGMFILHRPQGRSFPLLAGTAGAMLRGMDMTHAGISTGEQGGASVCTGTEVAI